MSHTQQTPVIHQIPSTGTDISVTSSKTSFAAAYTQPHDSPLPDRYAILVIREALNKKCLVEETKSILPDKNRPHFYGVK